MALVHAEDVIVTSSSLAMPSPEGAREAMRVYQEVSLALLGPEDMQRIDDGEFPKRSAFQKLANAYRVSTSITQRTLTHDADGNIVRCDAVVRATHPDGRYSEGDGACSANEKRFRRGGAKIDHDLPATAVTRAKNRAISDLVAFGVVSAEEAESAAPGGGPYPPDAVPAWAGPSEVPTVAPVIGALLSLFEIPDTQQATIRLGQATFDECGHFPVCVSNMLRRLEGEIRAAKGPSAPAEAQSDVPTTGDAPEAPATSEGTTAS